jgi:hypothetical protein
MLPTTNIKGRYLNVKYLSVKAFVASVALLDIFKDSKQYTKVSNKPKVIMRALKMYQ